MRTPPIYTVTCNVGRGGIDMPHLLYEYKDLFIDMHVRKNRSE